MPTDGLSEPGPPAPPATIMPASSSDAALSAELRSATADSIEPSDASSSARRSSISFVRACEWGVCGWVGVWGAGRALRVCARSRVHA